MTVETAERDEAIRVLRRMCMAADELADIGSPFGKPEARASYQLSETVEQTIDKLVNDWNTCGLDLEPITRADLESV